MVRAADPPVCRSPLECDGGPHGAFREHEAVLRLRRIHSFHAQGRPGDTDGDPAPARQLEQAQVHHHEPERRVERIGRRRRYGYDERHPDRRASRPGPAERGVEPHARHDAWRRHRSRRSPRRMGTLHEKKPERRGRQQFGWRWRRPIVRRGIRRHRLVRRVFLLRDDSGQQSRKGDGMVQQVLPDRPGRQG